MSSEPIDRCHPVTAFATALGARLERLARTPVWSMSPVEQREALADLATGEAALAALRLRVLAEAERSGATLETGAATAADWVAVGTRQVRREAKADLRLAVALEKLPVLASAFDHGQVNLAQTRVIVTALDRLPDTGTYAITDQQRSHAETHLVEQAAHHDAAELAELGRHLFDVIAPEVAEEVEGKILERQEALALRRTTFTMRADDEGTVHGRFRIPLLQGRMLHKMLLAMHDHDDHDDHDSEQAADPTNPAAEQQTARVKHPTPVARGLAFCDLIERIPAHALPTLAGGSATVVVTMTKDQLLADLDQAGVCTLDTGGEISASEARRLACTAGIIPAVLGSGSLPLDMGRRTRFHTPAQRIAMGLRDQGCTAVGCDKPPALCHAHHDLPWGPGGHTDVKTGRLLCGHHHRRLHDPAFHTTHHPDGTVSFHRRT